MLAISGAGEAFEFLPPAGAPGNLSGDGIIIPARRGVRLTS